MTDLQIEGSASEDELEDICNSRMRTQIGCKWNTHQKDAEDCKEAKIMWAYEPNYEAQLILPRCKGTMNRICDQLIDHRVRPIFIRSICWINSSKMLQRLLFQPRSMCRED